MKQRAREVATTEAHGAVHQLKRNLEIERTAWKGKNDESPGGLRLYDLLYFAASCLLFEYY